MPRKPNYKLERFERDRAKAEKKAARLQAKADRRVPKTGEDGATEARAFPRYSSAYLIGSEEVHAFLRFEEITDPAGRLPQVIDGARFQALHVGFEL